MWISIQATNEIGLKLRDFHPYLYTFKTSVSLMIDLISKVTFMRGGLIFIENLILILFDSPTSILKIPSALRQFRRSACSRPKDQLHLFDAQFQFYFNSLK